MKTIDNLENKNSQVEVISNKLLKSIRYIIYCIEIWGIPPQTHLTPLLLLQKKIVRIMTYSTFYTHTAPIFKEL